MVFVRADDAAAREIAATIDRFAGRDGFDLKRVALLGWSEAQRNGRLKTTMETFYRGFRGQLATAIDRWSRSAVGATHENSDGIARTLLSPILGHVVQAAIIGDITPDDMALDIAPATTGER